MIKPFRKAYIAGWSSQVARRAHNPKVARFESRPRNHFFGDTPPSYETGRCKQDKAREENAKEFTKRK